ncbi:hypothetical protein ACS0TY_012813 [Phlomoides rotata]
MVTGGGGCGGKKSAANEEHNKQLSLLDFILSALRKSMASTCSVDRQDQEMISTVHHMEIGWPTNVKHVTHVTFDRFHGFLGLPVEFEIEIPCKAPSASVSVCGVSADSLKWSYDTRCNSVPTILILLQEKLYALGGLEAEGIFRINPDNSKEEHVKEQLNKGIVADEIDVHCLASLIKSWFRELPSGVLDGLSPEQVLQCVTEEESVELVKKLKPTEGCLLWWAIDLMADVVEHQESNKMNARNIAMIFAPNMTKMSDPLTALMHAVQVTNLLKRLIVKRVREREETGDGYSPVLPPICDRQRHGEMGTSCESRGPASDDEELGQYHHHHHPSSEDDEYETESLSDIEYCFSTQLDTAEIAKDGFRKQLERILCRDNASPSYNADSGVSFSDSRIGSSCISMSDDEHSSLSSSAFRPQDGCKNRM